MSTTTQLHNPFLDVFLKYMKPAEDGYGWTARTTWGYGDDFQGPSAMRRIDNTLNTSMVKRHLQLRMAWAIPTDEAIMAIAELGQPVVEIGAGLGYWAWLLKQAGVDVVAYDIAPKGNHWCDGDPWTRVRRGGPAAVLRHQHRALMLCWPPYGELMAWTCLHKYTGDTLVFIGEGEGGCTAEEEFFTLVAEGWEQVREVDIPQWEGLHDWLTIYRRKR